MTQTGKYAESITMIPSSKNLLSWVNISSTSFFYFGYRSQLLFINAGIKLLNIYFLHMAGNTSLTFIFCSHI